MTEDTRERVRARVRERVGRGIVLVPLAVLALLLFAAVGGEVVRRLWNWLLPPLFGWQELTFWQALGMLALCRILFGGFGLSGGSRSSSHRMTQEERERIRQGMRSAAESPGP